MEKCEIMEDTAVSARPPSMVYECEPCSVNFESQSRFEEHKIAEHIASSNTNTRDISRSSVTFQFKLKDTNNSRRPETKKKSKPKKYKCGICRQHFSVLEELFTHMDTHNARPTSEAKKPCAKIPADSLPLNQDKPVNFFCEETLDSNVHQENKQAGKVKRSSKADTLVKTTKLPETTTTKTECDKFVKRQDGKKSKVPNGIVVKESRKVVTTSSYRKLAGSSACQTKVGTRSGDTSLKGASVKGVNGIRKKRITKKLECLCNGIQKIVRKSKENYSKMEGTTARLTCKATKKPCQFCNKSYSEVRRLKEHLRVVHSKDPKNMCTVCWKVYQQKYNLKRHSLLHTVAKPFRCSVCWKQFGQEEKMKEHQAQVHGSN